jgi:hypothetical protein
MRAKKRQKKGKNVLNSR